MKKFSIVAAVAALLLAGAVSRVAAQGSIRVPAGEVIICIIVCEGEIHIGGEIINANASGNSEFVSHGEDPDLSNPNCSFQPLAITVSGSHPVYGTFSFQFDNSRIVQNSTVVANQPVGDFPATADVYANVTGTISGLRGVFTNDTPCHMRTTTLQTFNPQVNERYTFVNAVTFTSDAGDQFTIPANALVILN